MATVVKWKKLPVRKEFSDIGWQKGKRWGIKIVPNKYYFEFKSRVINGKEKLVIEITDCRQPSLPSRFYLMLIAGKVTGWSQDQNTHSGDNQAWRASALWLDFKEKITAYDGFPAEYREFFANL